MDTSCSILLVVLLETLCLQCCGKSIEDHSILSYGQKIWLERALRGLERSLSFYKKHYAEVNLDSIYGLRVAEGSLEKSLTKLSLSQRHSKSLTTLRHQLETLRNTAKAISLQSMKHLKARNSDYFEKFKAVVSVPWGYSLDFVSYEPKAVIPLSVQKSDGTPLDDGFDEELSDLCMTSLMGTQSGDTKSRCLIPKKCWSKMTLNGTSGYFITHQALFFLLAEASDCHNTIIEKTLGEFGLKKRYLHLGSNIYYQAKELYKVGISPENKDLFMEEVVICGMLGIIQCYNLEWFDLILSWQDPSGCYKEPKFQQLENERIKQEEIGHTVIVSTEIIDGDNTAVKMKPSVRKLLEEVELSGGCLAHMTGIATGLLGMYIKWLVSPPIYRHFGVQPPWEDIVEDKTYISTFTSSRSLLLIVFIAVLLFMGYRRYCSTRRAFRKATRLIF